MNVAFSRHQLIPRLCLVSVSLEEVGCVSPAATKATSAQ